MTDRIYQSFNNVGPGTGPSFILDQVANAYNVRCNPTLDVNGNPGTVVVNAIVNGAAVPVVTLKPNLGAGKGTLFGAFQGLGSQSYQISSINGFQEVTIYKSLD